MKKVVKNMIIKALDIYPNPEIYIEDSSGKKVMIYDSEDLNDWAISPPLTVHVFHKNENKWETFNISSLTDVFTKPIGDIIEQNYRNS
jgi:hypothetical protein